MPGEIEQLGQPQRERPQRLFDGPDGHCRGADRLRRYRHRRQHEHVAVRQRSIDRRTHPRALGLRLHVVVARNLSTHFQPASHVMPEFPGDVLQGLASDTQKPRATRRSHRRSEYPAAAQCRCRQSTLRRRSRRVIASSNRARTSSSSFSRKYPPSLPRRTVPIVHGDAEGWNEPIEGVIDRPGIADVLRERSDVVERHRQRNDADRRDLAERGLQADDAACRGGNANRSAGVGADRSPSHPGGHGSGGAAARASWRASGVVRISHRPECRFIARRSEGELVEVASCR